MLNGLILEILTVEIPTEEILKIEILTVEILTGEPAQSAHSRNTTVEPGQIESIN